MMQPRSPGGGWGILCLGATLSALGAGCRLEERTEGRSSFESGKEAALANDHAAAINHFTVALESSRDKYFFTAAYLERGDSHLSMAKDGRGSSLREQSLTSALADFDLVMAQADVEPSDRTRALSSKGKALLERGDLKGAEEVFLAVIGAEAAPGDERHRLEAHRNLGWIALRRAQAAFKELKELVATEEEVPVPEDFRVAQDHFASGLEIVEDDWDLNLGKGICLYYRGQDVEAIAHLEKSTVLSSAQGIPNPEGHYHLAQAIESHKGYYKTALEHYRKAVIQDSEHVFRPLHAHLVEALPAYLTPEAADFSWFLEQILAYAPEDREYWQGVETLAARIGSEGSSARKDLATYARAVARARKGEIEKAVADALHLQSRPDFSQMIFKIFPNHERRPAYLYGRALALFNAKRYDELESFFQEEVFATLDPAARETIEYQKTLVLEGRNVVALWREETARTGAARDPESKLERDRRLGKARDAFLAYLEIDPQAHDVRMALGEVQELMESFPAAFVSYAFIAKSAKDHPEAIPRILKLHKEKLLIDEVSTEAWRLLRDYGGDNPEIQDYVRVTQGLIEAELRLYCVACGRKGAEGDRMCIECGRLLLGKVVPAAEGR
jgi:tetratricopeptide (TPR) repeat protein